MKSLFPAGLLVIPIPLTAFLIGSMVVMSVYQILMEVRFVEKMQDCLSVILQKQFQQHVSTSVTHLNLIAKYFTRKSISRTHLHDRKLPAKVSGKNMKIYSKS